MVTYVRLFDIRHVSDVQGPDTWLARINTSGGGARPLGDYQSSTRLVVSLTGGTVLDSIAYNAFGSVTAETDPTQGGRLKFQGGEYNPVTGLTKYGQNGRLLNSADGDWTTRDPMGFDAEVWNLYRPMGNVPMDGTDPRGTGSIDEFLDNLLLWGIQQSDKLNGGRRVSFIPTTPLHGMRKRNRRRDSRCGRT